MSRTAQLRVIDGGRSTNENGKVKSTPPRRVANADRREREYLTPTEVERLTVAAKKRGRWGFRDAAIITIMYRHGLRVSELVRLQWQAVDLDNQQLHVSRLKNGRPAVHPLPGDELRILRKLKAQARESTFVFTSERGTALEARSVRYIIAEAGKAAGLPFPVHPHQLRHACGYKLANDGRDTRLIQSFLGHRAIQHTARYTELDSSRFNGLWGEF